MRNVVVVVVLVIGLAVAGWFWLGNSAPAPQAAPDSPPAVPVTADLARKQDVPIYRLGLGSVQAYNTVTVHVRVDGQLDKVAFTEGQEVKAGDLLAQIDPRPFQAALDQVAATKAKDEAQLANAERDLDRYVTLAPQNFTSKQVLDTQRALVAQLAAQIKVDQAAIDNAKVQLGYTTITSPLTGRTGIRLIDQGNIVHSTDAGGLVMVTQLQPISVIFTLSETLLPAVSRALAAGPLKVEAWSQDDSEKLDDGQVALIDNEIDPATGTLKIKATFPNQAKTLWPGLFVNAVVKPDKTVELRPIKVGYTDAKLALIESGLEPGETVVVDGQYRLVIGGKVEVTMAQPKQTAEAPEPAK